MADAPHLHVEFYMDTRENMERSRVEGRPIFEDVEMVKIQIVGDPKNTILSPAHYASKRHPETGEPWTYAEQYPEHYRYFKDNADQQRAAGTPLTEVPWLTAAQRAELRALKIHTVDGLALLDGTALQRLGMGGRDLKNKAQAWLDAAAGHAAESRLAEELAARDREIEALKEQVALLATNKPLPTIAPDRDDADDAEDRSPSVFDGMDDETLKVFIAERSGRRPAGNPRRETLIRMAEEIIEAEKAAA